MLIDLQITFKLERKEKTKDEKESVIGFTADTTKEETDDDRTS